MCFVSSLSYLITGLGIVSLVRNERTDEVFNDRSRRGSIFISSEVRVTTWTDEGFNDSSKRGSIFKVIISVVVIYFVRTKFWIFFAYW